MNRIIKRIISFMLTCVLVLTSTQISTRKIEAALSDAQGIYLCFNATYYANSYSDLKKAFGYDYSQLLKHWKIMA